MILVFSTCRMENMMSTSRQFLNVGAILPRCTAHPHLHSQPPQELAHTYFTHHYFAHLRSLNEQSRNSLTMLAMLTMLTMLTTLTMLIIWWLYVDYVDQVDYAQTELTMLTVFTLLIMMTTRWQNTKNISNNDWQNLWNVKSRHQNNIQPKHIQIRKT